MKFPRFDFFLPTFLKKIMETIPQDPVKKNSPAQVKSIKSPIIYKSDLTAHVNENHISEEVHTWVVERNQPY